LNQSDFLLAPPLLDLGRARDGIPDVVEGVKINQSMHAVFPRELPSLAGPVAQHASHKESGHTDIDHAANTCHDVNVIGPLTHHCRSKGQQIPPSSLRSLVGMTRTLG
jgi:hypothetical protein